MHILVLLTDLFDAVGGIPTFNRSLVKALNEIASKFDWRITALVLNDAGDARNAAKYIDEARVEYLGFNREKVKFAAEVLRRASMTSLVIIGHVHFAPLASLLFGAKKILIVYGIEAWERLSFPRWIGLSRVDRILAISRFTANEMVKNNHLATDKFSIFPCTLEPSYSGCIPSQSRSEIGLPSGPMILSVSRLEASEGYKGIDKIIMAMPAVLRNVPDAFYVVAGEGTDRARLEKMAKELDLTERVFFKGCVPDQELTGYYQACDLFALPSTGEGFGIVFLEAMYCGKPCVGARAGAIPEVISDGATGLLVEPGNPAALVQVLTSLLANEELRRRMGERGRQRLDERFSFAAFRNRLIDILSPSGKSQYRRRY